MKPDSRYSPFHRSSVTWKYLVEYSGNYKRRNRVEDHYAAAFSYSFFHSFGGEGMRIMGWKLGLAETLFEFPSSNYLREIILFQGCCLLSHLNLLYFNRLPRQPWPPKWVWGQAQILANPLSSGVLPWSKNCSPWPKSWKSFAWQQHEHQNSRYWECIQIFSNTLF